MFVFFRISKNKELIDELLRSTASEIDEYSEDSEEDEDSEKSEDPKWQLYWSIRNYDVCFLNFLII